MTTKNATIFSLALIAIAVIAGLLLWNQLPEQMASHWNANDQVDGTMSRFWGVWMMPLMTLGIFALLILVPSIDPLKANIAGFRGIFNLFIVFMTAFMLSVHGLTLAWSLGYKFRMSAALLPFMGILFIFIGYMLKQAKRNFFIGIRTPWTLSSDSVWDKTHQLGSVLFMASGVLTFIGGFFLGGEAAIWLILLPLLVSTLFLVVYSYVLYRNETKA